MKKFLIAAAAAVISFFSAIASVSAAPKNDNLKNIEPFEGNFTGMIYGDQGTKAPIQLNLNQDGSLVNGTVELGSGLYVNGGRCGGGYIPSSVQAAQGVVNNRNVTAETKVKVGGFNIEIELDGVMSSDGESIDAEAKIDLPWFCGRDPVITAFVSKDL